MKPDKNLSKDKSTKPITSSSIKEKPANADPPPVSFIGLFRYATKLDVLYIILGTCAAIANGTTMPLFSLLFGNMANSFDPSKGKDAVVDAAGKNSLLFLYVGFGAWFMAYLSFSFWMITGERQANCFRREYFRAILRQDISYFDKVNPNELTTKIANETQSIQSAIGEKVSTFCNTMSIMITGFIIGYIKGWQLALVLSASLPILSIAGALFTWVLQVSDSKTKKGYEKAGAIAEQALNAVRTVLGLNGEKKEWNNYHSALSETTKFMVKFGFVSAFCMGVTMFCMIGDYSLGFWYGSKLISWGTYNPTSDGPYTVGDVLTVFFTVIMGAFSLGQASPCLKAFAQGKVAAARINLVIDRVPEIDVESDKGVKKDKMIGDITFDNVRFTYPSRPEVEILQGLSLKITPGKKTALVGESGCGKSTIMQLIERFYDPSSGNIFVDDTNVRDFNMKNLRSHIGYVGQEPVLFNTTVFENMKIGRPDADETMMWEALRRAKADEFVKSQPEKLNTMVGTGGAKLSGGQKQRLAIARAILKNPTILLLDEATSALDRTNEIAIQEALDELSVGRTTVIIAHRLSTIRNSDIIYVFDQGVVAEQGNHESLMAQKGKYYNLVKNQEQIAQQVENVQIVEKKEEVESKKKNQEGDIEANKVDLAIEAEKPKEEKKEKEKDVSFDRLREYSKPETGYLILGMLSAIGNGAVFPVMSIALANMIATLSTPGGSDFESQSTDLALFFFYVALGAVITNTFTLGFFSVVSEKMCVRLREALFAKMMRMNIGWFDEEKNQPGALAASLSTDTTNVKQMTGNVIGLVLQAISSFITGIIIAMVSSWKLTLISLAVSPAMVISGKIQAHFVQGFSANSDVAYKQSGSLISESVNNMRTVASFGNEQKLLAIYDEMLQKPTKEAAKKGHISGFFFGFSQFTMFGIYALVFYIGAIFNRDDGLSIGDMFRSIFAIIFAAFGSGQIAQFMPDVGAAKNSVVRIYSILDAKSTIDPEDENANKVKKEINGLIEFQNVSFKYPTRESQVLNKISFTIKPGQKIALVGPSGCGKSTIIQLLQRFYDPDEGRVLLDGTDIREYDIHTLRKQLGVVSQEPVLFSGTIEYNIKYTKPEASDEAMRNAAREANALDFIEKNQFQEVQEADNKEPLGTGFQRVVGTKGSQLSGGQKQRIAIARAIMKDPKIYLFDEATSALDTVSEKVVQDSLNALMVNRTSITIAHRLSTIRDADEILVLHKGEIIERGTYQHLIEKGGTFYKMEKGILE